MDQSKKKLIIIGCVVLIIVLLLLLFIVSRKKLITTVPQDNHLVTDNSPSATPDKPRVWQMAFRYNTDTKDVVLAGYWIKNGTIQPAPNDRSNYVVYVLDHNRKILYNSPIHISEGIMYQFVNPPVNGDNIQPKTIDSIVYVPYFDKGESIIIGRGNEQLMGFPALHQ